MADASSTSMILMSGHQSHMTFRALHVESTELIALMHADVKALSGLRGQLAQEKHVHMCAPNIPRTRIVVDVLASISIRLGVLASVSAFPRNIISTTVSGTQGRVLTTDNQALDARTSQKRRQARQHFVIQLSVWN